MSIYPEGIKLATVEDIIEFSKIAYPSSVSLDYMLDWIRLNTKEKVPYNALGCCTHDGEVIILGVIVVDDVGVEYSRTEPVWIMEREFVRVRFRSPYKTPPVIKLRD